MTPYAIPLTSTSYPKADMRMTGDFEAANAGACDHCRSRAPRSLGQGGKSAGKGG